MPPAPPTATALPPPPPRTPTLPAPLARLTTPAAILLGAIALRAIAAVGFVNYDTLYALVWGQQLARGETPQYGIAIAPTPHPLVEALGFALAPLGPRGATDVIVALGFVALSATAYVVYRLGALWFGRAAGALAALILLTRVPILSYGVRAYIDVPYLLLVLAALLVEGRRHRAALAAPSGAATPPRGARERTAEPAPRSAPLQSPATIRSPAAVLALLALAGLLRPEAWAFSAVYWLYLALYERRAASELARLAALVAAAPLIWVASDALVTGNPFWSLTNTRATAQTLDRATGIADVPEYIPRRIGEILRPPVLAAAALGGVLALLWLRGRALVPAIVGFLAVAVFAAFATVGLPINTRYAFLAAAILAVFAGAGVCGWTQLPRGDRHRRPWMFAGAALVVALIVYAPAQYHRAEHELNSLARQQQIEGDLVALVENGTIARRCGPVGVPNHRPIPLLALYLHTSPANVVSAQVQTIARGTYVDPATHAVELDYTLDPHDPHPLTASVPRGFALVAVNRSWRIYERCVAHA